MKELKEYQQFASESCLDRCWNTNYLILGLCGETGEVAEKIKKASRDGELDTREIAKELGDVLWYLTNLAAHLGYDLTEVAQMNKIKLSSRLARGVIHGEGDNR